MHGFRFRSSLASRDFGRRSVGPQSTTKRPTAREKKKTSGAGAMKSTLYLKKTCLLGRDVHVKNLDLSAINKDKVK